MENKSLIGAQIISVLPAGVSMECPRDLSMEILIPNLGGYFRLELAELNDSEIEDGRVLLKAAVDANASMTVTLLVSLKQMDFVPRA
jgi:hypothetical protein